MDYTNYSSPSYSDQRIGTPTPPTFEQNPSDTNPTNVTVRTVEPNRSMNASQETRLFGAYRNTNEQALQPVSTNDAPLTYPVDLGGEDALEDEASMQADRKNQQYRENTQQNLTSKVPYISAIPSSNSTRRLNTITQTNTMRQNEQMDTMPRTRQLDRIMNQNRTNEIDRITTRNRQISASNPTSQIPTPDFINRSMQMDNGNASRNEQGSFRPYVDEDQIYPSYGYTDSREADRDMEYMRQMYPSSCRRLLAEIDKECDRLEYDGSVMFDEYPDRETMEQIIDRIYSRVKDMDEYKEHSNDANSRVQRNTRTESYDDDYDNEYDRNSSSNDLKATGFGGYGFYPDYYNGGFCSGCGNNWFRNAVDVMFYGELFNRRRRYFGRRFWF